MKQIIATMTGRGQVTVPAKVRRLLGAKRGDKVAFVVDDAGTVQLTLPHYADVASARGAAGSLKTPQSWKEMQQVIREERAGAASPKSVRPRPGRLHLNSPES